MKEFLEELVKKDVHITLTGEELSVKFPKSHTDKEVLEKIRSRKQDILKYLADLKANASVVIPTLPAAEHYPVSNGQRRLWILSQLEEGSVAYNIPMMIHLNQQIDLESFKRAVASTIERHEILRTVFREDEGGELRQWVRPAKVLDFKIDHVDLREEKNKQEAIQSFIAKDAYKAFDLANGPLLKAVLMQLSGTEYAFYYNMHHIISDGWSMHVLTRDVLSYYEAYKASKEPSLKPLRIQYRDYSAWQSARLEGSAFRTHKDYWLESMKGELPVLDLPGAGRRPLRKTYNGFAVRTCISPAATAGMRNYAQENGGGYFTFLLAAWNVLMYRYTSQKDIIIGIPVAGREHADLEDQIGFYLNTLAFRNQVGPELSFESFYQRIKDAALAAYSHQAYPFDRLVEDLNLKRDTSRSPLFDILLDFHNEGEKIEKREADEKETEAFIPSGELRVKYDLELHFTEVGSCIEILALFNDDIYELPTIEGIITHYRALLAKLLDRPGEAVGRVDFLPGKEKDQLLLEFNNTKVEYPEDKTILDLFEAQAKNKPAQVAVRRGERTWSYKELDETANRLARCITENYGISRNDLVGIKLDKNEWAVISMLAVLKAGAAYVPIDPEYPSSRKQQIVSDSGIKLLITDTNYLFDSEEFEGSVFAVDVEFDKEQYASERPGLQPAQGDLAYVLYTSGSTGRPKGVMIGHGSLLNYVLWASDRYSEEGSKRLDFGLFTSLTFDLTVSSIFLPLVSGGTLTLFERQTEITSVLKDYFESSVTCIKITPAHIRLLEGLRLTATAVQVAIVGGDKLEKSHVEILRRLNPAMRIYNEYGPTESTVGCIVKEILPEDQEVLIGKPIANTSIYLLNEEAQLVPEGASGEICISGNGLAWGYLNQEALSREKFISNPFVEGKRLYKTGDLGRWLPDGNMEFIGRKDEQVKIRGYRIEPGEIEQALLAHGQVTEAVVLAREDQDKEKILVAYLSAKEELNSNDLRTWLKRFLPEYMLPSYYVQLEALPLTPNGKIDRKALPPPRGLELKSGSEYTAPRNKMEQELVKIWTTILKAEKIGIDDDLFVLGGDSMKAVQISVALNKTGIKITVTDLYMNATVRKLAGLIAESQGQGGEQRTVKSFIPDAVRRSVPGDVEDVYPISDMQRIMIEEYEKDTENLGIYHSVTRWKFRDERMSVAALEKAILALQVKNHPLRTVFFSAEGDIYQGIKKIDTSTLVVEDLSGLDEQGQDAYMQSSMEQDIRTKFRLDNWSECLIRFKVFMLSENTFEFMMSFHHAIVDGWGDTVFQNELMEYYMNYRDGRPVRKDELPNSFKEHVLLCKETVASQQANEFWWKELKDWKSLKKKREKQVDSFATKLVVLDQELTKALKEVARKNGVTLKTVFLTGFIKTLGSALNTQQLSVGVVFNGRTAELTDPLNTMGLFWNILPCYVAATDLLTYHELQDKLNRSEAFSRFSAHRIKERLGEDPNAACFNFIHFHNATNWAEVGNAGSAGTEDNKLELPVLTGFTGFEKYHYPLNINVGVDSYHADSISLRLEYNQAFFPDEALNALVDGYVLMLSQLK